MPERPKPCKKEDRRKRHRRNEENKLRNEEHLQRCWKDAGKAKNETGNENEIA